MVDRFEFVETGMYVTFQSEDGDVGRDLTRRGTRVQLAAKRQVGKDTHRLERSIVKRWDRNGQTGGAGGHGDLTVRVGSDVPYALMHHNGTQPHVIRPKNPNGTLRFMVGGRVVFAKMVHHPGTRPNLYLADNLSLAL